MKVIVPTQITDSLLTSSTIPEPDTGETVWAPYMSAIGDERISTVTHRVYRAAVASTDDPLDGINEVPPTWVDIRPTNKYAMFDGKNNTKSEEDTQLIVELTTGSVSDSISGFGIEEVNTINVTVTDPGDGEVYNRDVEMNDNSKVYDAYTYFNEPIIKKTEFILADLPAYNFATVKLTADGANIKFGNLIVGRQFDLGTATTTTKLSLIDFSRYELDDFGNTTIVQGNTAKLVDFDIVIPDTDSSRIYNTMDSLIGIPTVWAGAETDDDPTLTFGYIRNFDLVLTHKIQSAQLSIQGLT